MKELDCHILMAGRGVRLHSVTNGMYDKALVEISPDMTSLDYVYKAISESGVNNIIFQFGEAPDKHGIDNYNFLLTRGYSRQVLMEPKEMQIGSGGAVELYQRIKNNDNPTLVTVPDMHYDWSTLKGYIESHKQNSFTWYVSNMRIPQMDRYFGLMIDSNNRVLGDIGFDKQIEGSTLVTKGGMVIVEKELFRKLWSEFQEETSLVDVDFFWHFLPWVERKNRELVELGEESILNAYIVNTLIMDIGTPQDLDYVKRYYADRRC